MKLCICGGGTGGHLSIALALCEASKQYGHFNIFIGSTSGQDRDYFQKNSPFDKVYFLDTTGVVNKKGLAKLKALLMLIKAVFHSIKILKKQKIELVYSVGGFSAAPSAIAAIILRIPLFIHEQNAKYGKLNAILKPYAKSFISAYDESSPIKGYPTRDIFFQKARVRDSVKSVIFLGGSQGAKAINNLALSVAKELKNRGINIIHQTGRSDFERVKQWYDKENIKAEVFAFSNDMASLMSSADLAISRSGASTLWELYANALPAIFIPFPYAASNHQYYNAKFLVDQNLGWCRLENEDIATLLYELLDRSLIDKSTKLIQTSQKDVASKMIKNAQDFLKS